jgi:Flp pilus assembly protein TadB
MLRWARKDRPTWAQVLVWTGAALGILLAWTFLAGWYAIVFGMFGIFVIPYRIHRRHQRKELQIQRTQLATMQAMMAGQMKQPS